MSMLVEKPGVLTTVQDLGRRNYMALGIPYAGVMDWFSARLANALLDNDQEAALLECHFPAPELVIQQTLLIALCGGDFEARANGLPLLLNRPYLLEAGTTLRFLRKRQGERVYVGVKGGIQVPPVLGSRSTQLDAGFGGFHGRALRAGDLVPAEPYLADKKQLSPGWYAIPPAIGQQVLRVLPGAEWPTLTLRQQQALMQATFSVTAASSRLGVYWQTVPAIFPEGPAMLSSPVLPGTTQLFPNGQLVTLMADAQTVGGYPRLFQVIQADLRILAQASPGMNFRLSMVKPDHALRALAPLDQYLATVKAASSLRLG